MQTYTRLYEVSTEAESQEEADENFCEDGPECGPTCSEAVGIKTTIPADQLEQGNRILCGDVTVIVLRAGVESVETVWPLAGRPCLRFWCRREDTGEEGFVSFGPAGVAQVAPL
jgi:hypothetical protein